MKKKNKSKSSSKKKTLKIVLSALALLILIGGAGLVYYFNPGLFQNPTLDNNDKNKDDDNNNDDSVNKDDDTNNNDDSNKDDSTKVDDSTMAELGEVNVTKYVSWNEELNISSSSLFYQETKEDILSYYSSIDFTSTSLKDSLYNLLKDTHTTKLEYSGNNSSYGMSYTWANYALTDRDFSESPLTQEEVTNNKWNMNVSVDMLYSTQNITLSYSWNGGNEKTDREHILPKSYGFNKIDGDSDSYKNIYAGCDIHNLRMGEHNANSSGHSNKLYDELDKNTAQTTLDKNGNISSYYTDSYFMPLDEDKGEIARACLYMAIRYSTYEEKDKLGYPSPAISLGSNLTYVGAKTTSPSETKDTPAIYGELDTLLKWNEEDPVSENEMVRNNLVEHLQGNRNPFVDYPNLANILFK